MVKYYFTVIAKHYIRNNNVHWFTIICLCNGNVRVGDFKPAFHYPFRLRPAERVLFEKISLGKDSLAEIVSQVGL